MKLHQSPGRLLGGQSPSSFCPFPIRPVNRTAALRGLRAKLAMIFVGFSRPIKSAMPRGRQIPGERFKEKGASLSSAHPP